MTYPYTHLFMVRTAHASYPWLRVTFEDGEGVTLPQQWVASPPRAPVPILR